MSAMLAKHIMNSAACAGTGLLRFPQRPEWAYAENAAGIFRFGARRRGRV